MKNQPTQTQTRELKAYAVNAGDVGVLVFATTRNEARQLALSRSPWLDCAEYIETTATREPNADHHAEQFGRGVLPENADGQRVMRQLGWYCQDYDAQPCDWCGRTPWPAVPESQLTHFGVRTLCLECAGHAEKNQRWHPPQEKP